MNTGLNTRGICVSSNVPTTCNTQHRNIHILLELLNNQEILDRWRLVTGEMFSSIRIRRKITHQNSNLNYCKGLAKANIHMLIIPIYKIRDTHPASKSICKVHGQHKSKVLTNKHRWELPGSYPVFTVVMIIYHYVERIWRFIVTPIFYITYIITNIYYPGEPVNIHIQSLINIIQENNRVITTKKG